MKNTIEDMIKKHASNMPDKLAIATMNGELTYSELMDGMKMTACFLKSIGIKKSDCIVLSALPEKEYFMVYFALHLLGGPAAERALRGR